MPSAPSSDTSISSTNATGNHHTTRVSVAACLYSAIMVTFYGYGVYACQTVKGDTPALGLGDIAVYIAVAILLAVLLNIAFAFIDRSSTKRYDRMESAAVPAAFPETVPETAADAPADPPRLYRSRQTWRVAGVILAVWAIYLLLRFPGNADSDTLWEILQTYGYAPLSDHHPFFDNLAFGAFWHLGDLLGSNAWSLFLYAALQSVATAMVMAACVRMISLYTRGPWPARLTCLFFACYPIIPAFSQAMSKDCLNGWIMLAFLLEYVVVLQTRGQALSRPKSLAGLIVLGIFAALTKKTAVYIIGLTLLVAPLFCKRYRLRPWGVLAAIVLTYAVAWPALVLNPLGVQPGESKEMMSVPSQQMAYLIQTHGNELTDEDWQALEGVYHNPDQLDDVYVPSRADATKDLWNNDASTEAKLAFAHWYLSEFCQYPNTFLTAWAANTSSLLFMDTQSLGVESLLYYLDFLPSYDDAAAYQPLESDLVSFSGGYATQDQVHDLISSAYRMPWAATVSGAANTVYLAVANALAPLFSKVLFSTWPMLFMLCYGFHRARRTGDWFVVFGTIPMLIVWLTLIAGPVPIPRYMVIPVYAFPLLITLPWLSPHRPADTTVVFTRRTQDARQE